MDDEENLELFMEIAYSSLEEQVELYPTVVNNIYEILKVYNKELKLRKFVFKYDKYMAKLLRNTFQTEFQDKNIKLVKQEILILNYLIYKYNILLDSNNIEEIRNYLVAFENFMRFDFNFENFIASNNNYDRTYLADYMLQNNEKYLNNIKGAVKVLSKNGDKLCLNIL